MSASAAVDLRIGVDVGQTNTDSVVLDDVGHVLGKAKAHTTEDVETGIASSIDHVLRASGVDPRRVARLMIGTTSVSRAIAQLHDLEPVAVLRIGAPSTQALVPLALWPPALADAICVGTKVVGGGAEFDGAELAPLAEDEIRRFAAEVGGRARSVAISAVFSPVAPEHERRAAALMRACLGEDLHVSLSHELGHLGLFERENATILNAALVTVAAELVAGLQATLRALHLRPVVSFCQNDGTVMTLEHAQRYPVLTVGSGLANSMRGAAVLTGLNDALVIDVGGAATTIGELVAGFPRERADTGSLGGVPASFRMPDSITLPVGGDTIVRAVEGGVAPGPASLGRRGRPDACAGREDVLTLGDAAALAGRGATRPRLARITKRHRALLAAGLRCWDERLAQTLDGAKVDSGPQPVIAVGGAASLVPDDVRGASEVLRPADADVANAIGAATATVSGHVDRLYPAGAPRGSILEEVRREVVDQTIRAGGDPAEVSVVDIQEIALGYLPGFAVRVRAKAVAPMAAI